MAGKPSGHPRRWDVPPPRPKLSMQLPADVGYVQPPANFPSSVRLPRRQEEQRTLIRCWA